jgi:hypothetical protein
MTVNILVIPQVLLLFSAPEIIAKMSKPGFSGLFTSWATPLYFGTAYFALRKLEGFLRSGREGSNNIHWGELALVMGATSLIPSVGLTNTVGEFVIPSLMILTLMVLRDFRLGKDSGSQHEPSRQDSDVMARRGFLMTAAIGGAAALIAKRQAQTLRESKKTIPVTAAMLAKGISLVLATDSPGELLISLIYKTNSRKRVLKILGGWHMPMGGGSVTLQYDRLSFLPKVRLELELKYLPFLGGTNAIRVVGILPLDEELPQRRPPSLRGSPSVPRHSPHEASLAAAA